MGLGIPKERGWRRAIKSTALNPIHMAAINPICICLMKGKERKRAESQSKIPEVKKGEGGGGYYWKMVQLQCNAVQWIKRW